MRRLPVEARRRVEEALAGLTVTPRIGDIRKLQGSEQYRLRVGDWRVIFVPIAETREIMVRAVRPRGGAYR